ncbi:hypothetical protein [secondary endosymbiont of Ctenarytaina eucalypti]|uniref:Uncharacterized protein n=1 Tax=secondary endosymbiont of Ctenarytaina eucalypti TaxID=1199245 RepID=J3VRF2_9ENTR|nr:hypothetical protein [secondary endosymbiont of Ctenarytaina eucalypti]AFP84531.1 hypothetical protein A359_01280 [secondary endosymbiont of Ctenarytaina eucalypti]
MLVRHIAAAGAIHDRMNYSVMRFQWGRVDLKIEIKRIQGKFIYAIKHLILNDACILLHRIHYNGEDSINYAFLMYHDSNITDQQAL